MNEGKPVKGILGTDLPPNKNHPVKDIDQINVNNYDILVIPGGVKAMEKLGTFDKFQADLLAKFLHRLADTPEGNGSMLRTLWTSPHTSPVLLSVAWR